MFKKLLLLFLSLFLVLLANKHSKAQIVYPDKATFDFSNNATLIDFDIFQAAFPEYTFGPDASIHMYTSETA